MTKPSSPAPPKTAPTQTAPTQTSASAPATTHTSSAPAALSGSCAHHTVGECGWTVGVPPIEAGETATCKDGTASFSPHPSGTCANDGGVEYWYK